MKYPVKREDLQAAIEAAVTKFRQQCPRSIAPVDIDKATDLLINRKTFGATAERTVTKKLDIDEFLAIDIVMAAEDVRDKAREHARRSDVQPVSAADARIQRMASEVDSDGRRTARRRR